MKQLSNLAYLRATRTDLWDGEPADLMTREQYWEFLDGQHEWDLEQHIARNYGDCGAPITGTAAGWETEQEEARVAWGLPAHGF
jgi:hypothetical protein